MNLVELFEHHHSAVFSYIRRRVGSPTEAEDLSQEVFLRAQKAWSRYTPTGRDAAWIFRIATNVLLNFKRETARRPIDEPMLDDDLTRHPGMAGHMRIDLERALAHLPNHESEAFLLRECGGLGYDEIAQVTGATPAAVRNRIFRARSALRATLSNETR